MLELCVVCSDCRRGKPGAALYGVESALANFSGFFVAYIEIFLFIALLEELFFRGFLQTLVSNSLRSQWKGQLLISCLFGLFHICTRRFPNWRYVLLATVAGWFYGTAFVKGREPDGVGVGPCDGGHSVADVLPLSRLSFTCLQSALYFEILRF